MKTRAKQRRPRTSTPAPEMSLPTMFLGSSTEGLRFATAIKSHQKDVVKVTVWDKGVFGLSESTLDDLIRAVRNFDFATLVLTPDDLSESRGRKQFSARDNVLFECGLFFGGAGKERTFIVCDKKRVKIMSDLAGITLASYDCKARSAAQSVRDACSQIEASIKAGKIANASELIGKWRSRYRITTSKNPEAIEETVLIKPRGGKICIQSEKNPIKDNYVAYGSIVHDHHFIGEWHSIQHAAKAGGAFLLTIHPWGNVMYGFFVGPDSRNQLLHSTWVLARPRSKHDDINALLDEGDRLLKESSLMHLMNAVGLSSLPSARPKV